MSASQEIRALAELQDLRGDIPGSVADEWRALADRLAREEEEAEKAYHAYVDRILEPNSQAEEIARLREAADKVYKRSCLALSESHKEDTLALVEICGIVDAFAEHPSVEPAVRSAKIGAHITMDAKRGGR